MTPGQCRAARALIGWSQDQLADASKVAKATIANFELAKRTPYDRTLDDMRLALEAAGVIFVDENGEGPGVRLRKGFPQPPYTLRDFFATVDSFEKDRLTEVRGALKPARLAAQFRIKRRADGIDLFVGDNGPIGGLTFGDDGLKFVPDLIEGRDWTPSQWLTPNELARWVRQAWETTVVG